MTEQLKRLFIEIYKDNPQQMEYYVDKQMAKCADKQKRYRFRKAIADLKQKAITAMERAEVKNGIIIDNVIYEAVDFNGKDYDGTSACASCDLLDVCASLYNKNSLCQTFVYESKLLSEYVIFRKRKEKWNC